MPLLQKNTFGNIQVYKFYIRPTLHSLFGDESKKALTVHQQNIRRLIRTLMLNGSCTTWEMAKMKFPNDMSKTRTRDKIYRRLVVGRTDRGKQSDGLLAMGLIVKDKKKVKKTNAERYRLSLYGVLYCLDMLKPSDKEFDMMALKHEHLLPKIFGKWDFLKPILGKRVYNMNLLSNGNILDDQKSAEFSSFPFHELMLFLNIRYQNPEYISEKELAEQISYWFYTSVLFNRKELKDKNKRIAGVKKLLQIFQDDFELARWYFEFFQDAEMFYKERLQILNLTDIFPKNAKDRSKWLMPKNPN